MSRGLTDSLEDYLHAVAQLERANRVARVKDIADLLGVRMPSVTGALRSLGQRGYINYEKNSFVTLTDVGRRAAGCLTAKKEVVERLLSDVLGVDGARARDMAGRIEHVIDCETNRRMIRLLEYFETRGASAGSLSADDWLDYIGAPEDDSVPALCSDWCNRIYRGADTIPS
jgi:DtxR family Mn-dependent transcriptional regulator